MYVCMYRYVFNSFKYLSNKLLSNENHGSKNLHVPVNTQTCKHMYSTKCHRNVIENTGTGSCSDCTGSTCVYIFTTVSGCVHTQYTGCLPSTFSKSNYIYIYICTPVPGLQYWDKIMYIQHTCHWHSSVHTQLVFLELPTCGRLEINIVSVVVAT